MSSISAQWSVFLEGDNLSLGALYEELFEPLVFRAISYTSDPEVARDIVSQVFAEMLAAPMSVRQERWSKVMDPNAFLLVIVRNKSLDHLRVTSNRLRILKGYIAENEKDILDDSEKELYTKLEKCIASLSEEERKLLDLHLNGYRNEEIANELKLAEKTVRNRLSTTRKLLAIRWQQLFIFISILWN